VKTKNGRTRSFDCPRRRRNCHTRLHLHLLRCCYTHLHRCHRPAPRGTHAQYGLSYHSDSIPPRCLLRLRWRRIHQQHRPGTRCNRATVRVEKSRIGGGNEMETYDVAFPPTAIAGLCFLFHRAVPRYVALHAAYIYHASRTTRKRTSMTQYGPERNERRIDVRTHSYS
jgi:hypothetical protein